MRSRFLVLAVVSLALVALMGGVAYAEILPDATSYTSADQCYVCHQGTGAAVSRADFGVAGSVNYSKCLTCHLFTNTGRHYHLSLADCASCHNGVTKFALSLPADAVIVGGDPTATMYGYFAYAESLQASPAQLHALHDGGGWVERTWGTTKWPNYYAGTPCSGCHAAATCTACHDAPAAAHADHAASAYPAVSVRQATGASISYAASTCINPACHDLAKTGTDAFTPECGACHTDKTAPHGYADVDHVAADGSILGYSCSACHSLDLSTVHGDPIAIGTSCTYCHPSPRDALTAPWDQTCATGGCHTETSSAPMHAGIDTSHAVGASNQVCLGCHGGSELASIHVEAQDETAGTSSCLVCHTGETGEPATNDCTVCHFTFDEHYDDGAHTATPSAPGCKKCHSMDLKTEHERRGFGCADCHSGDYDTIIASWNKSCLACHPAQHRRR